ncbi:MAG: ABC transporter permease [Vicinamibacteria bacterium]|nr:ABC transporter permease [Vicinamibacteria bacterium]
MSFLTGASLRFHARAHLAAVLGVAVAVAALGGARLLGASVRDSLRARALLSLGEVTHVVQSPRFFREALAGELRGAHAAAPVIALDAAVVQEGSGRRAGRVQVFGVDERFWNLQAREGAPAAREAWISAALARELGAAVGDTVLARLPAAADVSQASLFGRKEALGPALRVNVARVLESAELGAFALRPSQQDALVLFAPLALVQRSLDRRQQANAVLVAAAEDWDGNAALAAAARLEDLGLRLRMADDGSLSLENAGGFVSDPVAAAARAAGRAAGARAEEVLTYLANHIRIRGRSVPYSLIAAVAPDPALPAPAAGEPPPLLVNDWAARELDAKPGDAVEVEFFLWREEGRIETERASFRLAGVVPIAGLHARRDLAPEYPGISGAAHLSDWDPPFPLDLGAIRPQDEAYWDEHRATPKAYLDLATAQALFGHRLGRLTSIRFAAATQGEAPPRDALERELLARLPPAHHGLELRAARAEALRAAAGTTDFGEYFGYFSFFVVLAALLLAGLFFRLGVEQRLSEAGLLRAVGFTSAAVRRAFLTEAAVVAAAGALLGAALAVAWARVLLHGLGTWWIGAVGTRDLALSVPAAELFGAALAGFGAALFAVFLALRDLARAPVRGLLLGALPAPVARAAAARRAELWRNGFAALALLLTALAAARVVPAVAGFFGAGGLALGAALAEFRRRLLAHAGAVDSPGALGRRAAALVPGRSVLAAALIAFASFVLVALGAFRHEPEASRERRSGGGGYQLIAEAVRPLAWDPSTREGRAELGLDVPELEGVTLARFRLLPGDDASCLNLYRPTRPRVLAPAPGFAAEARFDFAASLAATPEERENPWRLLEAEPTDGAIPAIGDANTIQYSLHKALGDVIELPREGASPVRLRLVASLRKSLFQGELLIAERHFQRLFPEVDGYRVLLAETPPGREDAALQALEQRLAGVGLDATPVHERLAAFQRVENTYLAVFQALGALGLLLGTLGLGSVLVRNVIERRRELALLRAAGYAPADLDAVVLAENRRVLVWGLAAGALSALLAVAPEAVLRAARFPWASLAALLAAVALCGFASSRAALRYVRSLPLIPSLKGD